jgi:rifampicin phosphotransferase
MQCVGAFAAVQPMHDVLVRLAEYRLLELPGACAGVPQPIAVSSEPTVRPDLITGIGVSAGRIEGIARVVTDPAFAEVELDEILVAPTTDPSWASIMFISAGLVVDIGGALSHAAVVARELGLPCVVNTRNGTSVIRTGDRLRLNGDAGTVEILS